jgi:hypothetical protein
MSAIVCRPSIPRLFSVLTGLALLLVLAFVISADSAPAGASHAGGMDAMTIDMDPTGNGTRVDGGIGTGDAGEGDANGAGCIDDGPANGTGLGEDDDLDGITDEGCPVLGTVQNCAQINENNVLDADEVLIDKLELDVLADTIPPSTPMFGFSFALRYGGAAPIIDGSVDIVQAPFGVIDANDDGVLLGVTVIDGLLDIAAPFGTIDSSDDGSLAGVSIINGAADRAAPFGTINSADDGGISASIRVAGVGFTPTGASDSRYLLFAHPNSGTTGTQELDQGNEAVTGADGVWTADDLDSNTSAAEDGSGVLKRVRIESIGPAVIPGVYDLNLTAAGHLDTTNTFQAPDAINNAQIAVNTPCPGPPADVEMLSLSLTSLSGPNVSANTPFIVEALGTARNNGPSTADIEITVTPSFPGDCTPTPLGAQSEAFPAVASGESRVTTKQWTLSCSSASQHNLSASGSVVITSAVTDSNPGNNGPVNDNEMVAVQGDADVQVSGVSVDAPPDAATGAPFTVTVSGNLHNAGPITPVNADAVLDLSVPLGCVRSPDNTQSVNDNSLALSTPVLVQQSWTVTCSTSGLKTFTGTVTANVDQLHVVDPTPGNNSGNAQDSTDTSLGVADVKVSSVTVASDPTADINTNFEVTVNTVVHNNGPFFPINADVDLTLNLPVDCFTPITTLTMEDALLGPSIPGMLPEITFFVGCTTHSFHSFTATAVITIDDPLAGDPTPGNNTATSAPSTTAVFRNADFKANSATITVPPTADANTSFNVSVDGSVHNNGPDPAPVDAEVTLSMPGDCSTPTNPLVVNMSLNTSAATPVPTQTFPVTCTSRSFHSFSATLELVPPLHVNDPTPGNNTATSTTETVAVFDNADLKVSSVTVGGPPSGTVNTAFSVTGTANVHNNGPATSAANGDVSLTLTLPGDCSTTDPNPASIDDVSFPVSTSTPLQTTWSVTCTNFSNHSFSASGTVTLDEFHVEDPNLGNNGPSSSSPMNVPVFALADGKITSSVVLSPPTFIAANTPVMITIRTMLHNNGPTGPVQFNLAKSVVPPAGCTVMAPPTSSHNLTVSTSVQVDEVWTINCVPGSYSFDFVHTLSSVTLHITDPMANNNTAHTLLSVLVDTDGDGIPDDVETACGSNPNMGTSIPERIDGMFSGVDDDGDVSIDEALPAGALNFDCDRDGFVGTSENHVYSPSTQGDQDPCGSNNAPPTSPPSPIGWPLDLIGGVVSGNDVDLQDLGTFISPVFYLNTDVGTNPGDRRWDLIPGSAAGPQISIQDMGALLAGSTATPPMLAGALGFNGPACPWAP